MPPESCTCGDVETKRVGPLEIGYRRRDPDCPVHGVPELRQALADFREALADTDLARALDRCVEWIAQRLRR